jgi:hypothetical protein
MKLLNLLSKNIILEVSEKVKNQLLAKFKPTTDDSDETILNNIDMFDRYKQGLSVDSRDIMRYSYEDLKNLIQSKETTKGLSDIFTEFKKKEKGIENNNLKRYIKKFLEIQSELPKDKQNILKFNFLNLVKLVDDLYPRLFVKKMFGKYSKENPNLTQDQILYYLDSYYENFDLIPFDTKGVDKMSFTELEHLLDGLQGKKEQSDKNKEDLSNIDLKYDENGLKIFAPTTKDQCIRLRNGRGWCTSREGSGNMYYNYRLGHERTLYYVIDEDKPFDDVNFATVILVDPSGRMAMADKSNSGTYGGSTNIPFSQIVSKVPKLQGLEYIFEAKPLTQEEKQLINTVKNAKVGDNPMESFNTPQEVEMWLEYNSPKLTDIQYSNIIPELKKKYIALGMDLSSNMIKSSEPDVLRYYISKKIDSIKSKGINNLSTEDVALLNTPILKKVKEEFKPKFAKELVSGNEGTKVEIEYPSGNSSKFVALYGFGELFDSLPENMTNFLFNNKSNSEINLDVPASISRFKDLQALLLMNCVSSIPENIGDLEKLSFLSLPNNPNLTSLPSSVLDLPSILFVNLTNSNPTLPEGFNDRFTEEGGGNGRLFVRNMG